MKNSKIIGKYQYLRKYNPRYTYKYNRYWNIMSKNFTYPKAVLLPEVEEKLPSRPEVMFTTTRYIEEIKQNTIIGYEDYLNFKKADLSKLLVQEDPINQVERQPSFKFNQYNRFSFGLDQAKILTKTVAMDKPYLNDFNVEIPNTAKSILDRFVLKANWWITDEDKFPKKYSPEHIKRDFPSEYGIQPKNTIRYLLTDLLMYCEYLSKENDKIFNYDHFIETYYSFRGNRVQFRNNFDLMIGSNNPLQPFETEQRSFNSQELLDKLDPVHPLIDMDVTQHYNPDNNNGWIDAMSETSDQIIHPHIITVNLDLPNIYTDFLEPEALQITQSEKDAIIIMHCFSKCMAQARQLYGSSLVDDTSVTRLPQPINILAICSDGVEMHFVCYQMNSTNLHGDRADEVANVAWFDRANKFYDKNRDFMYPNRFARYENLNLDVFRKFYQYYRSTLQ